MSIFSDYLPISLLMANPLELPKSVTFLKQNLLFNFVIEIFIQANMIDPTEALAEVIIQTLLTFIFVFILLRLNRTPHLYVQTVTAILFCENIVALFAVPIVVWLTVAESVISYSIAGLLVLWNFILITFIAKSIIVIDILSSMVVSFVYFAITYVGAYGVTILLF